MTFDKAFIGASQVLMGGATLYGDGNDGGVCGVHAVQVCEWECWVGMRGR